MPGLMVSTTHHRVIILMWLNKLVMMVMVVV